MRAPAWGPIGVALVLLHLGAGAGAQDSLPGAKARKPVAFFESSDPLDVTLTVDLKRLQRDRGDSVPWRSALLTAVAADGSRARFGVQLRTRGIWRRRKCEYPPLRLSVPKSAARGTVFHGLGRPKLVTVCSDSDVHEQYLLQEFQLYRVYQLLTPYSHRVRLIRLSYVDSASGRTAATRLAFIQEEPDALAARVGGQLIRVRGARADDLDDGAVALFALFQYLIGNTDFSISQLHNVELLAPPATPLVPIAHDFDFSGAVDATYATPDPKLHLRSVRERRYRGYCVDPAALDGAVETFRQRRERIFALYDDDVGRKLPPRYRHAILDYFRDFYDGLADRDSFRSNCLPRDQSDAPNR